MTTKHAPVNNPRVIVAAHRANKTIARCTHCDWEYTNTIISDVRQHAAMHRALHRAGATPTTYPTPATSA